MTAEGTVGAPTCLKRKEKEKEDRRPGKKKKKERVCSIHRCQVTPLIRRSEWFAGVTVLLRAGERLVFTNF
jgi:hypothetical protein